MQFLTFDDFEKLKINSSHFSSPSLENFLLFGGEKIAPKRRKKTSENPGYK